MGHVPLKSEVYFGSRDLARTYYWEYYTEDKSPTSSVYRTDTGRYVCTVNQLSETKEKK